MNRKLRFFSLLFVALLFVACSSHRHPEGPTPKTEGDQVFIGLASYYGAESGNKTASGADFDPNGMTAAHKTLPFGTRVMVTNLENNLSVLVTITDRGPRRPDRIIDLSFAAAKEINMIGAGVVKVRVEVVHE